MIWKDKELVTVGDLMDSGINACETEEEAKQFMALYRAENLDADNNIGYISGYYSPEEAARIRQWFGVEHPFIEPGMSPKEVFEAGLKFGKK
ncbi:hypothetical protein ACE41H_15165 [Paenibacillus enshidis]|uniref:Uncharacterized protein n=1 Tax=Paenibacillus enshidis TaxID=1458439 RepID=A0ABV5AY81_9BACL